MTEILGKAFREELSKNATDLINRLATILRNASVYDPNNQTWKPQIASLVAALGPVLRAEKQAVLETHAGQFSINKNMIRASFNDFGTFKYLSEALGGIGLSGIEFKGLPDELEVKRFAYAIAKLVDAGGATIADVERALAAGGVRRILPIAALAGMDTATIHRDPRVDGVYTFLKGVAAVHEIMEGLRAGKSVGFKRAKRFVQSAVDLMALDRGLLLALTTIKNYDDYLYNHSVNVCLLSLVVGAKLGFDKAKLGELGLAALLRDVGKAAVPPELMNKKGQLTPEEWQQMRAFPYAAVTGLLRFRGFNEGALRQVIVAFEHKFKSTTSTPTADPAGSGKDHNLFSKIAQLCDAYDAMTTPRPYRPRPHSPDEALRNMIVDRFATRSDPALIKTFIHAVGLYPVGSVVMLDTNELAIVAEPPRDVSSMVRPRVRLIADATGTEIPGSPMVDLSDFDIATSVYYRSIAKPVDRWKFGINVSRHLLSDLPVQAG